MASNVQLSNLSMNIASQDYKLQKCIALIKIETDGTSRIKTRLKLLSSANTNCHVSVPKLYIFNMCQRHKLFKFYKRYIFSKNIRLNEAKGSKMF